MNKIVFVTSNEGKIASAQNELKNIEVIPYRAELIEPRSDDIKEIAKEKVKQAYKMTGTACIAMDTGFFIDAWNGFPRAYVNPALDTLGIEGFLKLMDGIKNRQCEFRECLAYYDGEHMAYFESVIPCTMATSIRGEENTSSWSALWHIVIPEGFTKTISEFTDDDFEQFKEDTKLSSIGLFGDWFNKRNTR